MREKVDVGSNTLDRESQKPKTVQDPSGPGAKYPLLMEFLAIKQMELKPAFTVGEAAKLFNVSPRSVQSRVAAGELVARRLLGHAKFLATDLEQFIRESARRKDKK